MRASASWWAVLSATAAPVVLIGGWTVAAGRQAGGFDARVETISALAGASATDRWLMTAALFGVGCCHVVTACGLARAAVAGRLTLGVGGVATAAVAVFPLPATGGSPAHAVAASVAFGALAVWPALACRRGPGVPWTMRPVVGLAATAGLVGLLAWFAATLRTGGPVGTAERLAAAAQALWPLAAVLVTRRSSG